MNSSSGSCHSLQLPVRLAHRVQDLDELPEGLSNMPSINRVKEWYAESFDVSSYSSFVGQEVPFRADWFSAVELIKSNSSELANGC